jgi:hypothetical protein
VAVGKVLAAGVLVLLARTLWPECCRRKSGPTCGPPRDCCTCDPNPGGGGGYPPLLAVAVVEAADLALLRTEHLSGEELAANIDLGGVLEDVPGDVLEDVPGDVICE